MKGAAYCTCDVARKLIWRAVTRFCGGALLPLPPAPPPPPPVLLHISHPLPCLPSLPAQPCHACVQVEDELHHVSSSCCSRQCSQGPVVISHGRLSTLKLRCDACLGRAASHNVEAVRMRALLLSRFRRAGPFQQKS